MHKANRGAWVVATAVVGVTAFVATAGCGARTLGRDGDLADGAVADASVDGAIDARDTGLLPDTRVDTAVRPDTFVDVGPDVGPTCSTPLPGDFTCPAAKAKKGGTACNDVAIQAIVDACFGSEATSGKCSSARSKFSACGKCMLGDWIDTDTGTIDFAACMLVIDPKDSCARDTKCAGVCFADVCMDCDWASGEYDECQNAAVMPGGACEKYYSRGYIDCLGDPKYGVCAVRDIPDLLPFYRGACRDGGDWSKASIPDPVDGGVAVDGGGATDAAPGG